ncbi:MAG: Hsp70 family protein [Pseudoflavonifractor sp.]
MDLGIDLGTTYSAMARLCATGEAEILENCDGERVTPSAVYFLEDGTAGVSTIAMKMALRYPERGVTRVKDAMGTNRIYSVRGSDYSPEEISAFILKKLVKDAQARTGETVERVVIAVPATFSEAQRRATLEAARLAGFGVGQRQLISEPAAVVGALARGDRLKGGNLLIYDWGGGSFDVSVVRQEGEQVQVLSAGSYPDLGGCFCDELIAKRITAVLQSGGAVPEYPHPPVWPRLAPLPLESERCKKALSEQETVEVAFRKMRVYYKYSLARQEYETMLAPLVRRTTMKTMQVLAQAGLSFDQLDGVLLVGGMGRTPLVQRELGALCGKPLTTDLDMEGAVALGAARCAGTLRKAEGHSAHSIGL